MFSLPKQPLGFFETLKYSFILWWSMLLSTFLLSVVAGVGSSWPVYLKKVLNPEADIGLFIIIAIVISIISLIPYLGIIGKLGRATLDESLTLSQSLAIGIVKLPSAVLLLVLLLVLLGTPIIAGMYLFIKFALVWAMLILFILFFIFSVYLNLSFPLLVLDNLSPLEAIKNSIRLVRGHWWYVAGVIFITSIITIAIENIGRNLFQDTGFIIAFCIMLPLQIAASVIILKQLKMSAQKTIQ